MAKEQNSSFRTQLWNGQSGLTLLDMAILLLVLSLIAVPLIQTFKNWKAEKENGDTQNSMIAVNKAMSDFYFEFKRYPCPALLSASPDDLDNGRENCTDPSINVGNGMLVGAVPFLSLKIPPALTQDGWAHRLRYAVSKKQADSSVIPILSGDGALNVRGYKQPAADQCDQTLIQNYALKAHYVLISHGPDSMGAYTPEGRLVQACSGTTPEAENCDTSNAIFFHQTCARSSEAAVYYDDVVDYQAGLPTRIWSYSQGNGNDIYSGGVKVGIHNKDPQTDLDVMGNIRSTQNPLNPAKKGSINSSMICDKDGNNCFSPSTIGGQEAVMNCANTSPGSVMTGISNSRVSCLQLPVPGDGNGVCPSGSFITSISGGGISCTPAP